MGKAATWEPMGSVTFWQWVLKAERSECFKPPEPVRGRLCSTLLNPEVPGAHGHASTCDIYFQSRTAWIYPNMRHRKCSELFLKMQKQSHSCGGLLHPVPCNPHTWTRWEMALHCTLGSGHLKSPKSRDFTKKIRQVNLYLTSAVCACSMSFANTFSSWSGRRIIFSTRGNYSGLEFQDGVDFYHKYTEGISFSISQ